MVSLFVTWRQDVRTYPRLTLFDHTSDLLFPFSLLLLLSRVPQDCLKPTPWLDSIDSSAGIELLTIPFLRGAGILWVPLCSPARSRICSQALQAPCSSAASVPAPSYPLVEPLPPASLLWYLLCGLCSSFLFSKHQTPTS